MVGLPLTGVWGLEPRWPGGHSSEVPGDWHAQPVWAPAQKGPHAQTGSQEVHGAEQ